MGHNIETSSRTWYGNTNEPPVFRKIGINDEELDGINAQEEIELKREEQEEGEWNVNFGTSLESYTHEWSEQELKRE